MPAPRPARRPGGRERPNQKGESMKSTRLQEARQTLARVGEMMLRRNLTDLAGGNISARVADRIVMSPTLAGTERFWQLEPEEVLVLDLQGNKLEGQGDLSRETPTHVALLNHFYPAGQAVIHAHPRNTLVFCVGGQAMLPVLEGVLELKEVKMVEYAHGGVQSERLAQNVLEGLVGQEELMGRSAAVVMAPWHGVFGVGKDLYSVLETIDRIENNAYCILMSKLLFSDPAELEHHRRDLLEAVRSPGAESGG